MRRIRYAATVGVLAVVIAGCGPSYVDRDPVGPSPDGAAAGWRPIADSPLGPRTYVDSVWIGSELLIFGGAAMPPCPPGADCVGPDGSQVRTDGAAYDPASDTWRPIADLPLPLLQTRSTWTGSEVVVVGAPYDAQTAQPQAAFAYGPVADRWRQLPDPPEDAYRGVWSGTELVFAASANRPQEGSPATGADWALDPVAGTWRKLPADPSGATFDRNVTWVGDRFLVTGLPNVDGHGSDGRPYRVAEYRPETDAWTVLAPSTVGFWDSRFYFLDGKLVNPSQDANVATSDALPPGGQLDLRTGRWTGIAQTPLTAEELFLGCPLPAVGPAGDWLIGGGPVLVSLDPPTTSFVADCADLTVPEVAAWTGDELLVWGGPDADYRTTLNQGYRWTPPDPD